MRATISKLIRRRIYGKGHHPGQVYYRTWDVNHAQVIADLPRQDYKAAKRRYHPGKNSVKFLTDFA